MPLIQIVDENDTPLYGGDRKVAQKEGLWHRIVRIIVEDEQGRILIQKRSNTVVNNPGKWDNGAAGHVDEGESYEAAARRELNEELGVSAPLKKIDSLKVHLEKDGKIFNRFVSVYRATVPSSQQFKLQQEEVSEVRWMSVEEVKRLMATKPGVITQGLQQTIEKYYSS